MGNIVGNDIIKELTDRAYEQLPDDIDKKHESAWIAQRVLELAQQDRTTKQTVQVLLSIWLEKSGLWREHPMGYSNFRQFLKSVGNESDGTALSPSTISDIVAIAEVIAPYCTSVGIEVSGYITSLLWSKMREGIPALRDAVNSKDVRMIESILSDVKSLPTRAAMREKYRSRRTDKIASSDYIVTNGHTYIITMCATEDIASVKAAIGRFSNWELTNIELLGDEIHFKI